MATQQQFQTAFERVDAATTAIAALIRDLRDQLGRDDLTPEQEQAQLDKLSAVADSLEAMAKTPENPVPVAPPAPSAGD